MRNVCGGPCQQRSEEGRSNKATAIRFTSVTPPTTTHPTRQYSSTLRNCHAKFWAVLPTRSPWLVDEHTGHTSQQSGLPSKTTPALFNGIFKIIQQRFNAHGHKVASLHGDAERVNTSLCPLLGSIGTELKVSLPGHHAHRAERKPQTIAIRARSVTAGLPYHLPPELFLLLLDQSVGKTLNNSICNASAPLTPNEAFRLQRAPIPFGRSAMVTQPEDKLISISKAIDR